MKLAAVLVAAAAAVLLAIGACTASSPPLSELADRDAQRPEPVRATEIRTPPPLTGLALAVASGDTALFVMDMDRVQLTHPAGSVGGAEADSAATLAHVRGVVAGLQFWAEDAAVVIDGPLPFTGRARSQTRGGVLRLSLTPRSGAGSSDRTITAEVRGDDIVGRVWQRSPSGHARPWTHSAFFRGPLRSVPPGEWPPRAPRSLSAEALPAGGVMLRWTVASHAPPDAEYVIYRTDRGMPPSEVGRTRAMHFIDGAPGTRIQPGAAWHVASRSAAGALSTPSPSASLP